MARTMMSAGIAALVLVCWTANGAVAQDDPELTLLYGEGVHAYFAGEYQEAHELFTSAIEQGSKDARCYF